MEKVIEKNYGLDVRREELEQDGTEYLAGRLPLCKASGLDELPFEEQKKYFPAGEVQRSDKDDMQDCASRDKINYLEAKYNWLLDNDKLFADQIWWADINGYLNNGRFEFSDAYIAIKSGTTKRGNSLKAPLQAIHEWGLVPKKLLPLEKDMTWEDYHDPERITDKIKDLGKSWQEIMGEIFYGKEYDYNKKLGLVTGVYAWNGIKRGMYQMVDFPFNHAVWLPSSDDPLENKWAFDNYIDSVDGDFIKKLAPNYRFLKYAYSIVIGEPKKVEANWWDFIFNIFKK